jgi:ankyrin repeat protein
VSFNEIRKAIKEDKLKALKKLVEKYPIIVNLENSDGETPLFIAVQEEKIDIVKYLIDNEADINHKSTKDGWSVLHLACHLENVDIVRLLLDNDADIELTTNTGATPLYLICDTWANIGVAIEIIEALLDAAKEKGVLDEYINQKDDDGYFPLYIASKNGGKDVVELLLEYGANVEETDEQGQTALMIAIQENTNGSHLEVIDALLGADADLLYTDNNGHTALFYAQQSNDAEVFELFMRYAPNLSPSSTPSSTHTPTSGTPKSTIDSFEPSELDIISINKSQLPETAEDIINIEDVNIVDFLAESDQNRIIKVHNSFYAVNGEDIKSHYLTGDQKKTIYITLANKHYLLFLLV